MNQVSKPRFFRLGICLAGLYAIVVVAVYCLIRSSPPDDGLEWIPFVMLAMPWFRIAPELLIPGLLLNAAILYGIGAFVQTRWRSAHASKRLRKSL
jgi:hypothetical protein